MQKIFDPYIKEGLFTHAYAAAGFLTETSPRIVCEHYSDQRRVFDLASLTKALATTPLYFAARRSGALPSLDLTLGDWLGIIWPEGLDARFKRYTIAALLRHESGLPAWLNFWVNRLGVLPDTAFGGINERREHMVEVFNRTLYVAANKKKHVYSDVGFLLLGLALETFYAKPLDELFYGFCASELGFDPKTPPLVYGKDLSSPEPAIPTAFCALRQRLLVGEVHDENCAALGGVCAHAGLFGHGEAVVKYLLALGGSKTGLELIQANKRALGFPLDEKAADGPNEGLIGWRQGADPSSVGFGGGKAMGHMGFTGTAFWICEDDGAYAILLTNRVISGRMRPGIAAMRREVFTKLWHELH